jgi:hypothetical protein
MCSEPYFDGDDYARKAFQPVVEGRTPAAEARDPAWTTPMSFDELEERTRRLEAEGRMPSIGPVDFLCPWNCGR